MLFTAFEFVFLFLPATFVGFLLLRRLAYLAGVAWLIAASLFFYAFWNAAYLWLLVPSIVVNYGLGRWLDRLAPGPGRKAVLAAGIAANLGVLAWFKYAGFLVANLDPVLGLDLAVGAIVLPLGISFITFQKIAYLVDSYRGHASDRSFLRFALFVSFFPQLIAGPIVHHAEIMPQLRPGRLGGPTAGQVAAGLTLFAVGMFKKVVLADGVAPLANLAFGDAAQGLAPGPAAAWAGTLAYTLQLYFDFSGYSDMACGLALLFGVRLPPNFYSPYKAASIVDFWRRWHITLSRFLRDYLYIPLGGNRRGPARRHVNLLLTMVLGGLWHGAGWTFILWGLYHGLLLLAAHAWREGLRAPRLPRPAGVAITFLAVMLGWVLFRSETFAAARLMFDSLAGLGGAAEAHAPSLPDWLRLAALLAAVWLLPNTVQLLRRGFLLSDANTRRHLAEDRRPAWKRLAWRPSLAWAAAAALCFALALMPTRPRIEFLYFQF
ncbi:MBOAT family O-acyltransferase [Reyranella sp.]|uniref:MBOAT family O-acyltransferase n=1 Tax=Reyranella sp. TaxID=1929291 RepID=UPI003BAB5DCA